VPPNSSKEKRVSKLRVLFCASEVYPFAKSGGLADVAHSLPRALKDECDIEVVMPLYKFIDKEKFNIQKDSMSFSICLRKETFEVTIHRTIFEGVSYIFIASEPLSNKDYLYGTATEGYSDNSLRFSIFNHAIIELLKMKVYDIAHLNDWQSALVPLLLQEHKELETKTLFTIHNLAYQGLFPYDEYANLGIDSHYFTMDALEFYGQINFLKAAIAYANNITTVSPNYAIEILTPEFGVGLEGFLAYHKHKLSGILNGLDSKHFCASTDELIYKPFTNLSEKKENKKAYLKESGLRGINKPLFAFIGRLTEQKGMQLLEDALEAFASSNINITLLGEGDAKFSKAFEALATKHKNIYFEAAYNEALSHKIYASADFLLMPSLFEPCGLNQMISMSYGALPIVHKVGGLKDSVKSYKRFSKTAKSGYGLLFNKANSSAFINAIKEAQKLYEEKRTYNLIAKHNMSVDFSWNKSAKEYLALYKQILGAKHA